MLLNAYLLAKIGAAPAENERHSAESSQKHAVLSRPQIQPRGPRVDGAGVALGAGARRGAEALRRVFQGAPLSWI